MMYLVYIDVDSILIVILVARPFFTPQIDQKNVSTGGGGY